MATKSVHSATKRASARLSLVESGPPSTRSSSCVLPGGASEPFSLGVSGMWWSVLPSSARLRTSCRFLSLVVPRCSMVDESASEVVVDDDDDEAAAAAAGWG